MSFLLGCSTDNLSCDDVKFSDGLWYERSTSLPATGKVVCVMVDHGSRHESTYELLNGTQIGQWTYTMDNVTIHTGTIVNDREEESVRSISKLFGTELVSFNEWREGGSRFLDLRVANPTRSLVSSTSDSSLSSVLRYLEQKYSVSDVNVTCYVNSKWISLNDYVQLNRQ